MDLFRRYFQQIRTQLIALTISQKLLIGLLALVMVATIFFTVIWSAKPQLVPLTGQPLTSEDINRIEMVLKGHYDYQISGTQVLVPAEQQYAIRGQLWSQQAMPKKASAFTELISNQNPFTPDVQNARAWNNALQIELTRNLQNFPYIDDASVIVSLGQQAGLGRTAMPSTASVSIKTKGNDDVTQNQVLAIVEMVMSTVSGMKREDVTLVVNGQRTYHAPSNDTPMPSNLVEYKKALEDYFTQKLFNQFSMYGDVKIAVNVTPDLSVRHLNDIIVDPKNKVVAAESEQVRESTQRDGGGVGGEPGIKSNETASAGDSGSAARGGGSTSTENNTHNKVVVGELHKETMLPAGVEYKELTANLLFPRSFFVSVYRRQNPDIKAEPDDKTLQEKVIDPQLKSAVASAKAAIGAKSDDQVRVDWYDDTIMVKAADVVLAHAGSMGGGVGGIVPMVAVYAKQGVLAIVALGVLGMMMMMVRRAVPAGVSDEVDVGMLGGLGGLIGKGRKKGGGVEQLDAADDVFGEANQGEAVLTGIELDDETLASRKMVDEVSTMIKENPENAAALVKRWMSKTN